MGLVISDGTGKNGDVKVSADNRLYAFSLIETPMEKFGTDGDAYWISTDFIALTTTASFSGILYIKNLHTTKRLHVAFWRQSSTVNTQWRVIKSPTTGTLISGGTPIVGENSNLASGKTAFATLLKGVDGSTITDGVLLGQHMTSAYNALHLSNDGAITLYTGNSIALEAKPTVAGSVGVTMTIWFEDMDA